MFQRIGMLKAPRRAIPCALFTARVNISTKGSEKAFSQAQLRLGSNAIGLKCRRLAV
jgi:hypothetical protein